MERKIKNDRCKTNWWNIFSKKNVIQSSFDKFTKDGAKTNILNEIKHY